MKSKTGTWTLYEFTAKIEKLVNENFARILKNLKEFKRELENINMKNKQDEHFDNIRNEAQQINLEEDQIEQVI